VRSVRKEEMQSRVITYRDTFLLPRGYLGSYKAFGIKSSQFSTRRANFQSNLNKAEVFDRVARAAESETHVTVEMGHLFYELTAPRESNLSRGPSLQKGSLSWCKEITVDRVST
jgi:hypothetical protein